MEKILKSGYKNLWYYFMGKSRFGKTYGWGGHRRNGSEMSTPELILKDAMVDIQEVLRHVRLKFRGREGISYYTKTSMNYVTAILRRPNYPSNCYDVDITKLNRRKVKGFFQIQFNFHPVKDYKVEIILEDKKKALSRTYKYNRFGTQGSRIVISDLPSKIYKYASNLSILKHAAINDSSLIHVGITPLRLSKKSSLKKTLTQTAQTMRKTPTT